MDTKEFETFLENLTDDTPDDIVIKVIDSFDAHQRLVCDLTIFLRRARAFKFHDFKSTNATPKQLLSFHIDGLKRNLLKGAYDNDPDPEDLAELKNIAKEEGLTETLMKAIFGEKNV